MGRQLGRGSDNLSVILLGTRGLECGRVLLLLSEHDAYTKGIEILCS